MFGMDNSYTGATQFAGGGFMHTNEEPASASRKEYSQSPDSMRSVTIKQLRNAVCDEHDVPNVDGEPVKNVTIVGTVLTKHVTDTNVELRVYDGTGDIAVKSYALSDNTAAAAKLDALQPGKYCRVYGLYRHVPEGHQDGKHISAFNVRPVTDHNEVVYHNLTVIFEHQFLTKGKVAVHHGQQPAAVATPAAMGHGSTKQAVVNFYQTLSANMDPNTGRARATEAEVFQGVGPGHSRQAVRAALAELANDGFVYEEGGGFVLI